MSKDQCIQVLGKDGMHLSYCTKKRACQLIARQAADWAGYHIIKLRYDRRDKKRFKKEAMERDGYTCYICDKVMHENHPEVTADHIIAKDKGGTDLPENLACCCLQCNEEKGNLGLQEFLDKKLGVKKPVSKLRRRNDIGKRKQAAGHSHR